jgi:hypothetical protein
MEVEHEPLTWFESDIPLETPLPEAGASLESILCTEELQRARRVTKLSLQGGDRYRAWSTVMPGSVKEGYAIEFVKRFT